MTETYAAPEPEWTRVLDKGKFHLRVFQRQCPDWLRAEGVYALGAAVRLDMEIFQFNFMSLESLKEFCRELEPISLHIDGKSALADCLPLTRDGGG